MVSPAMSTEPHNPFSDPASSPDTQVALTTVTSYSQAATLIDALKRRNIESTMMDGTIRGHGVEAVAQVSVLVRRVDLERAELVLETFLGADRREDWPDFTPGGRVETRAELEQRIAASHRGAWTLAIVVLMPLGILVTIAGSSFDPAMRMAGPLMLLVAMMITVGLIANRPQP